MNSRPYYKTKKCVLYQRDNLELLKSLPDNYVDLVYIDPPFSVGKDFKTTKGEFAFSDKFTLEELIGYLIPRIKEMHRILKNTGSFYLHGDCRFIPYLRIECDKIFGIDNFRNEIIWKYGLGGSSNKQFAKKHDTILFYSKSKKYTFNLQFEDATSNRMKGKQKKMIDVWDIPNINNMAKERLDYPTQKPIELLHNIISASSNKGDIVIDCFMGSGTTGEVSLKLGRKFIGCDIGDRACQISKERLKKIS